MSERVVHTLNPDDCRRLLRSAKVGRLAFVDADGPVALPFNFATIDDDIAIRLEPSSTIRALQERPTVAFEVDDIDEADNTGWSVVVRGRVTIVAPDAVPALVHRLGEHFPRPWAAGVHNTWLTLSTTDITGRGLGSIVTDRVF